MSHPVAIPPATARDVPLIVRSQNTSSERRITPSWSIAQLKRKLESVTGIPSASQKLTLKLPGEERTEHVLEAEDEETVQIGAWRLVEYGEIFVTSLDPTSTPLPSAQSVPKYAMPEETYEALPSTVRAYKKTHQIGRFDPKAPDAQAKKVAEMWKDVDERGLSPPLRCRISSTRHGTIAFVGAVPSLPGPPDAPWIGIELDEPVGKNDGSLDGKRYFTCGPRRGVFVRPERVEVGEWGVLGLEGEGEEGEEMEEI